MLVSYFKRNVVLFLSFLITHLWHFIRGNSDNIILYGLDITCYWLGDSASCIRVEFKLVTVVFDWLSGQVARNSEPYMRQVFVTGDIDDEGRLARQVRRCRTIPNVCECSFR